jgi:hypothetical protein
MKEQLATAKSITPLPPDDHKRNLVIAQPNTDQDLSHLGLVGDTSAIDLLTFDSSGRP